MKDNNIRLAGIVQESLVNGPGLRRVLFSQGCKHKCEGCFNPHTHSFTDGEFINMDEIIEDIISSSYLRGITFSGGDPWEQADKFAYIGKKVKEKNPKLSIWSYTGYTFEYILQHKDERPGWHELLDIVDVVVDGKFEECNCQDHLRYRGSANQRIIDVKESLLNEQIKILDF